jgi:hypothetical protein
MALGFGVSISEEASSMGGFIIHSRFEKTQTTPEFFDTLDAIMSAEGYLPVGDGLLAGLSIEARHVTFEERAAVEVPSGVMSHPYTRALGTPEEDNCYFDLWFAGKGITDHMRLSTDVHSGRKWYTQREMDQALRFQRIAMEIHRKFAGVRTTGFDPNAEDNWFEFSAEKWKTIEFPAGSPVPEGYMGPE